MFVIDVKSTCLLCLSVCVWIYMYMTCVDTDKQQHSNFITKLVLELPKSVLIRASLVLSVDGTLITIEDVCNYLICYLI